MTDEERKSMDASYQVGYLDGFDAAKKEALSCLKKWFWGTSKAARACADEIRSLESLPDSNTF